MGTASTPAQTSTPAQPKTHSMPAHERRGLTIIHGLHATPQGDKPWVARLVHEPDFGFPLLVVAGAILLEESRRHREAQFTLEALEGGARPTLDAEALTHRVINDSRDETDENKRELIRFDALSYGADPAVAPAVFGNPLNFMQFGLGSDVGVSRVIVVDCQERSVRIYGHNLTAVRDSAVEHLSFGAVPALPPAWAEEVAQLEAQRVLDKASLRPAPALTEREEALLQEARDIQMATTALTTTARWTINSPSRTMQAIESAALAQARDRFDDEAAARIASALGLSYRSAASEPKGTPVQGTVLLVDTRHVFQHDAERQILWIHAVEDFHGAPPAEGQRVVARYASPSHAEFAPLAPTRGQPSAGLSLVEPVNRPAVFQHAGRER